MSHTREFKINSLPGYVCKFYPGLGKAGLWLVYEPPSPENKLDVQITSRATAKAAVAAAHEHAKWKSEQITN